MLLLFTCIMFKEIVEEEVEMRLIEPCGRRETLCYLDSLFPSTIRLHSIFISTSLKDLHFTKSFFSLGLYLSLIDSLSLQPHSSHTHSHPSTLTSYSNPPWFFLSSSSWYLPSLSLSSFLGFTPFDPAVRSNYQSLDATTESLEGSKLSKIKISRASSERRMTKELISPRLIDEEVDSPRVQPASCARRTSTDSGTGRSRIHSLSSPAAAILLLSKQSCDGSVTAGQNDVQNGTVEAEPLLSHVTSRSSMRGDWNSRADSGIEWEDTDAEKARKSSTTDRSAKILATIAGLQVKLSFYPTVFCTPISQMSLRQLNPLYMSCTLNPFCSLSLHIYLTWSSFI